MILLSSLVFIIIIVIDIIIIIIIIIMHIGVHEASLTKGQMSRCHEPHEDLLTKGSRTAVHKQSRLPSEHNAGYPIIKRSDLWIINSEGKA